MHRNTSRIIIALLPIVAFKLAALEPYKRETSPGPQVHESAYYVSGTWHMKCTDTVSGRYQGTKSIEIEKTNGKVIPRTGFYETSGVQPVIDLWHSAKSGGHFTVRVGRNALRDSTVKLTVGGRMFEKVWSSSHTSQCWTDDDETLSLLRLMLSSKELNYSYVDASKHKVDGVTKLEGFRDILKHGVEFLGFNPFAKK